MSALKERREALLRAHMIDLNAGEGEPAPALTPAEERQRRVAEYAARIAAGRPLHPGQRLTRRDRAELADTDDVTTARPVRKAGRKPKDDGTKQLSKENLSRDQWREVVKRARVRARTPPAWVGPHRLGQWRELLARESARLRGRG